MRDFAIGIRLVGRGFSFWSRRPKAMLLGLIPAVVVTIIIGAALIALAVNIADISSWLTGFAADWGTTWRDVVQVIAGVLVFGLALWLSIIAFTTLTILIGDPFYEAISAQVESQFGAVNQSNYGWLTSLRKSIVDAIRLCVKSVLMSLVLFLIGFIPGIGAVIATVIGAFVGGWFLAVELSAFAFNRRDIRYRDYRAILARRRTLAVGFGTPIFLLFIIPLGAVIAMPAAVAGATLLAREALDEASTLPSK